MPNILIRNENSGDAGRIAQVTREAFADHAHSSHTEHFIVDALRRADALTVSLVAEAEARVVGHIAFSPVTISDGSQGWYGLGPLSVMPSCQGQGIGRELVIRGLERLRNTGAKGCVLLGEPAFYGRFGFACDPELRLPGVPPGFFQSLPFGNDRPRGDVAYHAAFDAVS